MTRRPVTTGEEQDAFTGWRHLLVYMGRPGVVKTVKRRYHKKERRWAKAEIRALRSDKNP